MQHESIKKPRHHRWDSRKTMITSFVTFSQTFTQIDLMTGGGPGKSTYTMVYYLYQEAFSSNRFGRASAIAFVLFAVILVFSLLQLRMRRNGGDL